jgi:hypothetical protein
MYVYAIAPIDFWYGWTPLTVVLNDASNRADDRGFEIKHRELFDFWAAAQKRARALGWEGDIRGCFGELDGGPWFAPLPVNNPGETAFMIAWKQDNNGDTFVASSIPLPWLQTKAQTPGAEHIHQLGSARHEPPDEERSRGIRRT